MSVHNHGWKPRSDIGMGMYSCECGYLGVRQGKMIRAMPYEREKPAPTVGLKDQPRRQDYESSGVVRPKKVHRSPVQELGIGEGKAFNPSPTYRRVCVAMLELGSDRPLQVLADMAECSIAFVREVQAHVMADD